MPERERNALRRDVAELRVRQLRQPCATLLESDSRFLALLPSEIFRHMAQSSSGPRTPSLSGVILAHIAADWTEFAEIRAAARALSQKSRLTNALSIAVNEVRVALAAALLSSGRSGSRAKASSRDDEAARLDTIQRALRLHAHARAVVTDCAGPLATDWHLSELQVQKVLEAFASVVGGSGVAPPAPAPVTTSSPRPLVQDYGQTVDLFLAAVVQGMPAAMALAASGQVGSGHFSHEDKCFYPVNVALGPVADRVRLLLGAERRVVRGCEGEADITLFWSAAHGVREALALAVAGGCAQGRWRS